MKAKIEKIEEKTTTKGNNYVVVTLAGRKYSVFNPSDCVNIIGWGEGSLVEYETEKKDKYENIKSIKAFDIVSKPDKQEEQEIPREPRDKNYWENKNKCIIRENSLTQANQMLSTLQAGNRLKDLTNEQVRELLFKVAEQCEDWVNRKV